MNIKIASLKIAAWSTIFFTLGLLKIAPAFAERMEMVTYYTATSLDGDRLSVNRGTVGPGYKATGVPGVANAALPDGTLLVEDQAGIGTTNPTAKLEVVGDAATSYNDLFRLSNPDLNADPADPANDAVGIYFDTSAPNDPGIQTRDWAIAATNPSSGFGGGKLVFYDDTPGLVFPQGARMVIDGAGNVGIGTTDPAGLLHVQGADDAEQVVTFMPGVDTDADDAITTSLKIGVGTAAPSQTLEVIGNAKAHTFVLNPSVPDALLNAATGLPINPVEGMIFYNNEDDKVYLYSVNNTTGQGFWRTFVNFSDALIDENTYRAHNQVLTTSYTVVGAASEANGGTPATSSDDLSISDTPATACPQRGLYSVLWTGQLEIDGGEGQLAYVQIRFKDDAIIDTLSFDDDDPDNDPNTENDAVFNNNPNSPDGVWTPGTYTTVTIDGGTILKFNNNEQPKIKVRVKKNGKNNKIVARTKTGMHVEMRLLLPF